MHSEYGLFDGVISVRTRLNPLKSGHAFRAALAALHHRHVDGLNPLKSGHAFRVELNQWVLEVSELSSSPQIGSCIQSLEQSGGTCDKPVLIPSNRVMHSE